MKNEEGIQKKEGVAEKPLVKSLEDPQIIIQIGTEAIGEYRATDEKFVTNMSEGDQELTQELDALSKEADATLAELKANLSGEQVVEKPKSVWREAIKEDPRYQELKKELIKEWEKATRLDILSAEGQNFMFGEVNYGKPNISNVTVEDRAKKEFIDKFPEDAKKYEKEEKIRIYDDPSNDPEIRKIQHDTSGTQDIHLYLRLIDVFPEKAHAYHDKIPLLKRLYESEMKKKKKQEDEAKKSKDVEYINLPANSSEQHTPQTDKVSKKKKVSESVSGMSVVEGSSKVHVDEAYKEEIRQYEAGLNKKDNAEESPSDNEAELSRVETKKWNGELDATPERISSAIHEARAISDGVMQTDKELAEEFYLPELEMNGLLGGASQDEGMKMVETDAIVGSCSLGFSNWNSEYELRHGRSQEVAEDLLSGDEKKVAQRVFHMDEPHEQIRLLKLDGPAGPMYWTKDGSHRTSGVKRARMQDIPARVEKVRENGDARTSSEHLKSDWEKRIQVGLIKGHIEEKNEAGQKVFLLKIESQALPWMALEAGQLARLNTYYEKLHPGAFDGIARKLNIPVEVFSDRFAMNFLLIRGVEAATTYIKEQRAKKEKNKE